MKQQAVTVTDSRNAGNLSGQASMTECPSLCMCALLLKQPQAQPFLISNKSDKINTAVDVPMRSAVRHRCDAINEVERGTALAPLQQGRH